MRAIRPTRLQRFWLWARSWIFTTHHKKVGILYLWITFIWFLAAGLDALMIRWELLTPEVDVWAPDLYNGFFTYHGTQMVFLFAIPVFTGFGNIFIPKMIGASDMAFPKLNALGFWLVFWSGMILRLPLFFRQFGAVGWTNYVPLSTEVFSPTYGQDWWIWAIFLETSAATLAGINFLVTVLRCRRPGLKLTQLRPFVWGIETASVLSLFAGPFLLMALLLLFLDRHAGAVFFDFSHAQGTLLWQHVFWFYSHPATYIMILPGFGIIAEIIPLFSGNRLFSYKGTLFGLWGTTIIGMAVFWHHMFMTGMDEGLSLFGMIMTYAVAIPTGVLFFTLIATMWRGRIQLSTPMLFALSVIGLFTIGGIDGVYMASIPLDIELHGTYWLVAHIHFVLFGGTLMAAFAGMYYWFPQMFGRRLNETAGKWHFWGSTIGMLVTFGTMHQLGIAGMVRRVWAYPPEFQALNIVASAGSAVIGIAQFIFLGNVLYTLFKTPREEEKASWEPDIPQDTPFMERPIGHAHHPRPTIPQSPRAAVPPKGPRGGSR